MTKIDPILTCGLPSYRISGDRNLALGSIPCVMTRGRPVFDAAALAALGARPDQPATFYSDGSACPVSPESARLDIFINKLIQTVRKDRRLFFLDGVPRVASINWLRDHVHEMKAYKHWETDLLGYLDFTVSHQHEQGFFFEIIKPLDDSHVRFVDPECLWLDQRNHLAFIRLELEADIEYLVVEGAVRAYRATGNEDWIRRVLPALEKAINYCTSHPKRWDPEHGLAKRPFTIDTWDFAYGFSGEDRRIHPDSPMSIMHGDNTGLYQAMCQLAWLNSRLGNPEKQWCWAERAARLKENLDRTCWNGRFFTHQVHLNHTGHPTANEQEILSLSNAYALNRGATTDAQTQSILDEYQARRHTAGTFAEWFSVQPPYDRFNALGPNTYINGSVASFTAGELARAAFKNGREAYGWDILTRLQALVERDGELYFLYDAQSGRNHGGGPSGWGAASILAAIDEGLAGIEDLGVCYNEMAFSPRWAVTGLEWARYITGYECSKTLVESVYHREPDRLTCWLAAPAREVRCHILLPDDRPDCAGVRLNGTAVDFRISRIRDSSYVDLTFNRTASPGPHEQWLTQNFDCLEILLG